MSDNESSNIPTNDIRARLVYVEHRVQDHKSRIGIIEKWAADLNVLNAHRDEQWTAMISRLNNIDNNIKWVVRLFFAGFITAAITFIVGGGLNTIKG